MRALTRYLAETNTPAYIRVGRAAVPDIYREGDAVFTPGKANRLRAGKDVSLLACGEMSYHALQAAAHFAGTGYISRRLGYGQPPAAGYGSDSTGGEN